MINILFTSGVYLLTAYLIFSSFLLPVIQKNNKQKLKNTDVSAVGISILVLCGFMLRIILSAVYEGHDTDINCFYAWSDMIFNKGITNFYSSESFTDYPPGYMYVLYVIGFIKNTFHIGGKGLTILIKLPAVLCDCGLAFIVYKKALKQFSPYISLILSSFIMFSPAIITDSALWGQVDSVYTIILVLMILCVMEDKMIPSYFLFAAGIFIKPQMLIFTPIIIYGIIENVFMAKKGSDVIIKNLFFGLAAILSMLLLSLPFGLKNVFLQYVSTLKSYPYMTINAFNIWGAFGHNWKDITPIGNTISYIFMLCVVALTVPIFLKSKRREKYMLIAAMLSIGTFMLMAKMHERYAYPCIILLMMAFIYKPDIHLFNMFSIYSITQFINIAFVLFVYQTNPGHYYTSPIINVFSIINIVVYGYFLWYCDKFSKSQFIPEAAAVTKKSNTVKQQKNVFAIQSSTVFSPITKTDIILITAITLIYSAIALHDLGDRVAPVTGSAVNEITVEFEKSETLGKMMFFPGRKHLDEKYPVKAELLDTSKKVIDTVNITRGSVYSWNEEKLNNKSAKYVRISCEDSEYIVNELAFFTSTNELITVANSSSYANLFDEQQLIPEYISYSNGTYFDEIYHARTANEFINHDNVYEWTHPPLGKIIISIGIRLFGMNPFGWRISGTIFGILMVPVIYLFAKRCLKHSWLAAVTCILFTFDFMHFVQTRIATIDVYVTFFIMLMYYFMYKYYNISFYDTKLSKTFIPLGICGFVMGLSIASKWTGLYAAVGLAILFFMTLWKRWREYEYALKYPDGITNGISHKHIIEVFKSYTIKTILFCCIFFVAVPAVIYIMSYIPFLKAPDSNGFATIIKNQHDMYMYHSKWVLNSTHSFSSVWYEWPIMKRPIWYYSATVNDNLKEGISAFGNPLVWWVGIAAFIYQIYIYAKTKDKTSLFLIIAYLTQLVPWIPITRLTFIYHYFPSVPFVVLLIGMSIYNLYNNVPATNKIINVKNISFAYAAAAILLFAIFYPILSGQPINPQYVHDNLEWFKTWVFI